MEISCVCSKTERGWVTHWYALELNRYLEIRSLVNPRHAVVLLNCAGNGLAAGPWVCAFLPLHYSTLLYMGIGHWSSTVPGASWGHWGDSWECSCPSALPISKCTFVGFGVAHKISILCKHLPEGHRKKKIPSMEFVMPLAHIHSKLEGCLSCPCSKQVARTVCCP